MIHKEKLEQLKAARVAIDKADFIVEHLGESVSWSFAQELIIKVVNTYFQEALRDKLLLVIGKEEQAVINKAQAEVAELIAMIPKKTNEGF